MRHLQIEFRVEDYGGKKQLPHFLASLQKRPEFAQQKVVSMAVLRDADNDSAAAFTSVCEALRRNAFPFPAADATYSDSAFRVGVFIVGVNGRGMIEDVCLQSVGDRPEFTCVDEYFNCIAQKSSRSQFLSKAKVRVWMASQADFEYHVGKAAEAGYWPWESPAFDPLKAFLRAL